MTTRRWMVAVGIVAVIVAAGILTRRSRSYAALAAFHADRENECRRIVEAFEGQPIRLEDLEGRDRLRSAKPSAHPLSCGT
jgi:hypothetical protein